VTEPALTLEAAQAVVETKTAPRITEDSIKARIAAVDYSSRQTLTLCFITMTNGYISVGVSKPASADNYDIAVGERYAYEDAFKPLWKLEAYLLLERASLG